MLAPHSPRVSVRAVKINGADPDFHRRDLWDAITQGDFPEWELGLQLFDEGFAVRFDFDVLDPTKIIPEEQVPVRPVGRLAVDRVVVLLPSADGAAGLARSAAARDFVTDAYAHYKFSGEISWGAQPCEKPLCMAVLVSGHVAGGHSPPGNAKWTVEWYVVPESWRLSPCGQARCGHECHVGVRCGANRGQDAGWAWWRHVR